MRNLSRRRLLSSLTATGAFGLASSFARGKEKTGKTASPSVIKVAGYDYDRVRAIVDGQVGLPDYKVDFDFQDIYRANQSAFGPERKYEVTELGLIPYVTSQGARSGHALHPRTGPGEAAG